MLFHLQSGAQNFFVFIIYEETKVLTRKILRTLHLKSVNW